jgi:uncharacterized protein YdeI (YjbR/CyaY-like superfamily)
MNEHGLAKIKAAKKRGFWDRDARPAVDFSMPKELAGALALHGHAKEVFDHLARSCKKAYIGWIATAKQPATRERRIRETIALLAQGKKLGLK